jgi:putative peptidoglycan lipid II flippase
MEGAGSSDPADVSLVRSSGIMAVGTLASRMTGFLRTAILLYAVGTHDLGNAYNIANTLPNAVYNLALGGILTSVVVPLLVNAAKRERDRGEAYDQRIFTLGVLTLGGITVIATLAAAPIAGLYGHGIHDVATRHLTVIFAYFFIPQIFFYGVSSLAGAILNARGRFGAPMWTPVINNMVVILVGIAFIATAGLNRTPTSRQARFSYWASAPPWASFCRPPRWSRRCGWSDSAGARDLTSGVPRSPRLAGWAAGCSDMSLPPRSPSW